MTMRPSKIITFVVAAVLAATALSEEILRPASPAAVNPAVRSPLQQVLSLDGEWTFRTDPKKAGEAETWFLPDAAWTDTRPMPVSGCWEAQGVEIPSSVRRAAAAPLRVGQPAVISRRGTINCRLARYL
jgi:hypothetical protein